MPRDGTQTYILPFPDVVADTTIESPVYNGFTNDVAQDLNAPRPITSGGTGATSAAGALAALGGETASQVVTNYDSYVFKPGSFYSAAGATAAPTANAFSGICYLSDASNIVIEARDATTGIKHVRRKVAGVWGAFAVDASASFVELAGDTMTGDLILTAPAKITGAAKGHLLGAASGAAATAAVANTDANLLLYNTSATNWAGIGTDSSGNLWFKVGASGSPVPAMYLSSSGLNAIFPVSPTAPTPAETDISTKVATTAYAGAAWTAFTPSPLVSGGGAATGNGRFKRIGKTVFISVAITVTTGGTGCTFSLPAGITGLSTFYLSGREFVPSGFTWLGLILASGSTCSLVRYDNVTTVVTGAQITLSGILEAT